MRLLAPLCLLLMVAKDFPRNTLLVGLPEHNNKGGGANRTYMESGYYGPSKQAQVPTQDVLGRVGGQSVVKGGDERHSLGVDRFQPQSNRLRDI